MFRIKYAGLNKSIVWILLAIFVCACQNNDVKLSQSYFNLGNDAYNRKNLKGAIEQYTLAIKANSKNYLAYFYRGCAKDELDDANGAIDDFTTSAKIKPDFDMAYGYRASVKAKKLHDTVGALMDFDSANLVNTGTPKSIWYAEIGVYEDATKQYEKALSNFNKAISIKPDNSEVYNDRGSVEMNMKDTNDAQNDFEHAIKLNPNYGMAYFNRGVVEIGRKRYADAITDFNIALKFEHDISYQIYADKGKAELAVKQNEQACEDLNRAYGLGAKSVDSLIKKHCGGYENKPVSCEDGKKIFMANCAPCHAFNKPIDIVGPSLYEINKQHSDDWIRQFIIDNQKLINSNDAAAIAIVKKYKEATHPRNILNTKEVNAVIEFLKQEDSHKI